MFEAWESGFVCDSCLLVGIEASQKINKGTQYVLYID